MSKNYEMAGPERILKKKWLFPWDSEIIWIIKGECNEVLKELCNCRSLLDPASFHRLVKVASRSVPIQIILSPTIVQDKQASGIVPPVFLKLI